MPKEPGSTEGLPLFDRVASKKEEENQRITIEDTGTAKVFTGLAENHDNEELWEVPEIQKNSTPKNAPVRPSELRKSEREARGEYVKRGMDELRKKFQKSKKS